MDEAMVPCVARVLVRVRGPPVERKGDTEERYTEGALVGEEGIVTGVGSGLDCTNVLRGGG